MHQKGIQTISHFYNFNALRFVAAFLVVLHHAESLRKDHRLFHLKDFGLFQNGANAVTFFFVLSGFLITYLLLKEQGKTATISIKHFYLKRVLRIWPFLFFVGHHRCVYPTTFGRMDAFALQIALFVFRNVVLFCVFPSRNGDLLFRESLA